MSRIVTALPFGLDTRAAAKQSGSNPAKQYFERIGQYVPAEIIAGYTTLNAVLLTVTLDMQFWAYLFSFLLCWGLTPVYFHLIAARSDKPSLKKQMIVSAIAFPIWAYNIDAGKGIFGKLGPHVYQQGLAAAALVAFSLISGCIIPRKK
jgi:hypothetical protein